MNAVSVDVDFLEQLPAKTILRLAEKSQSFKRHEVAFQRTVSNKAPLFVDLEAEEIEPRFDFEYGSIDLTFTGNSDKLGRVWGILRRHGYSPGSRPEAGKTSFAAFWSCEDSSPLFMIFTSSVCKRVQVGTELKEVPIYETRCEEFAPPELEPSPASIAIAEEAS
jgi:hypothetical protein